MSQATATSGITGRTRMLFILADPVDHVRGTALLTEYFRSRGADAAVAPLHVEPQDLRTVLNALRCLQNVAGFGITIPHKIAVVPLLDSITERAAHIGAVNFVRRDGGGRLHGDNIDGIGFLAGLQAAGIDPRGMTVLQVGAGGAGRAIAFALAAAGVGRLQITNRSMDKAMGLAASVQRAHPGCSCDGGGDRDSGYDLVVNTTSLGMRPGDVFPLPPESLTPGTIVAEVIMSPEVTPLMEAAQARNCRVVPGKAMLIGQMDAAARFAGLWD